MAAKKAKKPVKKSAGKPASKAAAKKKPVAKKAAAKPAKVITKKAAPAKAAKPVKPTKVEKPAKKLVEKAVAVKPAKGKPTPAPELKAKKGKEKPEVVEPVAEPAAPAVEEEVVLTDSEGRRYCRVKDCDQLSVVDGYCRYHYLLYWKKIQVRKKILSEGKLERYIEDLTARYPDKFLDMLRKDLRSDKEFLAAIAELEIDESAGDGEFEDETQNYLDEVRGMSSEATPERADDDF
jgi:hypothetical protein